MKSIVLGGGCFWCIEALFQRVDGVANVIPGYAGGKTKDPTYEQVSSGNTGHAEVVLVEYDSNVVGLDRILELFFLAHDPTTLNRQGADIGSQYRSIILYSDQEDREIIDRVMKEVKGEYDKAVVTEIKELGSFYQAEKYHIDYYNKNRNARYCKLVIEPKLKALSED